MPSRRTVTAALSSLGLASALLVLAPTSASAASCYASSCTGKDPSSTGCASDAITAKSTSVDGIVVELRYSRTCRAAWARIRNANSPDVAKVENNAGNTYSRKISSGTDTYTLMVNDKDHLARACGTNDRTWPLSDHTACTGWF